MTKEFSLAKRLTNVLHNLESRLTQDQRASSKPPAQAIAHALNAPIKTLLNQHENSVQFTPEGSLAYRRRLHTLLSAISSSTLQSLTLDGLDPKHSFAMLALGHPQQAHVSPLLPIEFDHTSSEFCIRFYYTGPKPTLKVLVDGHVLQPFAAKARAHRFFDTTLFREHIAWFNWSGSGALQIKLDGKAISLAHTEATQLPQAESANTSGASQNIVYPRQVQLLRMLAQMPAYRQQFKNAWLFMDRDTQADDNAEHLYRYVRQNQPHENAWFILRDTSHDWKRLQDEGFRLLPFGGLAHKLALLNADHLLSSHADPYVAQYLPEQYYGDLLKFRFTFLQHGVIQGDLSEWLNYRPIRHFLTSAQAEKNSIIADDTGYRYTTREVVLTGMPRHDALLRQCVQGIKPRRIVVMPTWRHSLVGETLGMTNDRKRNPLFAQSTFFKAWCDLLNDPQLKRLVQQHGYELVFFPHANMQPYLDDFEAPHASLLTHADVDSIQDLFVDTAVLITDYSSVAFEVAYLERPVLYYQFDRNEIYQGAHFVRPGYFDYHRHGFGPVCTTKNALLSELGALLNSNGAPAEPYAQRMKEFFAYRDGRCSERVYNLVAQAAVRESLADESAITAPAESL